jgi:hypothetical protein
MKKGFCQETLTKTPLVTQETLTNPKNNALLAYNPKFAKVPNWHLNPEHI